MTHSEARAQFEALVRKHGAELFRYAYWLTRDRQRAEDTLQESLLRAWRAFDELRSEPTARAWLYAIVRNEFNRAAAREAARPPMVDIQEVDIVVQGSELFRAEARDILGALPPGHAEALALQVLGGFSCAEIAVMMTISEGAVMTRLTRARQALRRLLAPAGTSARRAAP